ncbi:MAG: LysM peptidoglycan-binding domain-containing protein [Verrucomicrobiota bacterium]
MKKESSNKPAKNRKKKGFKLFARTHSVSAHLDHERDWQTDVPDIKLSRAFVFVLLLHVIAVVGILAFEFFKPDLAGEPLAGTTAAEEKLAEIERKEKSEQARRLRDTSDGYYRYTVKSGDSLEKIASRYGVGVSEISRLNVLPDGSGISLGAILRLPISEDIAKAREKEMARLAKMEEQARRDREERVRAEKAILSGASGPGLVNASKSGATTPELVENAPPAKKTKSEDFVSTSSVEGKGSSVPKASGKEVAAKESIVRPGSDGGKTAPKVTKTVKPSPEVASKTYTVQPKDTLYGIGRKFGVSYKQILAENKLLDPNKLSVGQVLRIPRS